MLTQKSEIIPRAFFMQKNVDNQRKVLYNIHIKLRDIIMFLLFLSIIENSGRNKKFFALFKRYKNIKRFVCCYLHYHY